MEFLYNESQVSYKDLRLKKLAADVNTSITVTSYSSQANENINETIVKQIYAKNLMIKTT